MQVRKTGKTRRDLHDNVLAAGGAADDLLPDALPVAAPSADAETGAGRVCYMDRILDSNPDKPELKIEN